MSEEEKQKEKIGQPLPVTRPGLDQGPKVGDPVDLATEEVTPITREEIKSVDANDWSQLNIAQLYEQLNTLEKRMEYARSIGHQDMMTQLSRGITRLRALIHTKTDDEIKLI